MRTFFVFAAVATIATLSYVFGPDLVEGFDERANLVAERQVVAVVEDTKQPDGATFEANESGESVVRASLTQLRLSVAGAKPRRAEAPKTKKPKARALHHKRRTAAVERAELRKMGLEPAAADNVSRDEIASAQGLVPARPSNKSIVSPMSGRWIDGLSGPKARLDMGVKTKGGCADAYSHCERPAAPSDINVAGIVVRPETIVRHPDEPFSGRVRRGNYIDATPAVYVE